MDFLASLTTFKCLKILVSICVSSINTVVNKHVFAHV